MAILEASIMKMNEPKPNKDSKDLMQDTVNYDALDLFLISDSHIEYAMTSADALGIPRHKVVFVSSEQPLRSQVIMDYKGLRRDQLIGFFTEFEIEFLMQ